ncbi:MAG: hypothetical protein LBK66_11005 [Spirochaetaceae bacterium]|jgi:hypothetical protein|nr:hypothetical protein [Spirochaetaceae bacterium]
MKKIIVLMLAGVFVLSFAACTSTSSATSKNSSRISVDQIVQVFDNATTRGGFKVTGPVTGGNHGWAFGAYLGDISELGYEPGYIEEEYFIEGTAQYYQPVDALAKDGKWTLEAVGAAPYKTRLTVRRPADPAKFNGTVIVEWANVSAGYEISLMDNRGIYDEGFAYAAVSAQVNGLYGFEENPRGLIPWDSERYGSLDIPNDGMSYDIFTQAARAVSQNRPREGVDPMGGLEVKKLFALGESQSGSRVLSYANGVQPVEKIFDAIIIVASAGRGTDFLNEMAHVKQGGKTKVRNIASRVREDINGKVFVINTQTESLFLGKLAQPDTDNIRSWQIAGASHSAPSFIEDIYHRMYRDGLIDALPSNSAFDTNVVDWSYVVEAAMVQIQNWIDYGKEPAHIPAMQVVNMLFGYKTDKQGNARGGVRLPELEVPVTRYFVNMMKTGLSGHKIPFKEKEIKKLYATHQDYVDKVTAAAMAAEKAGIILPYRAEEYIREAAASSIAK